MRRLCHPGSTRCPPLPMYAGSGCEAPDPLEGWEQGLMAPCYAPWGRGSMPLPPGEACSAASNAVRLSLFSRGTATLRALYCHHYPAPPGPLSRAAVGPRWQGASRSDGLGSRRACSWLTAGPRCAYGKEAPGEPMSDFAQLPLHCTDHVQWRYEVIRP